MKNEKPNFRTFAMNVKKSIEAGHFTAPQALIEDLNRLFEQEDKYIDFTRVNSDVYGNPRYVCYFGHFLTDKDKDNNTYNYETALTRAKKIGGGKYNNKTYGGGIVFQSYNIDEIAKDINELIEQYK